MIKDRLLYFMGLLMAIPVFPVMLLQAKKLKKNFPDLPEAQNPKGQTGTHVNRIRLLTLGESSVAGVGVKDHQQGISGQMASELSKLSDSAVDWEVIAKSGYTARQVREYLLKKLPKESPDILVIGLGGNDTFKLNSPWYWKQSMRKLVLALHKKYPKTQIVITYMPPVHTFIAFSSLIRFFLGHLTKLLGSEMKRLAEDYDYLFYFDYVVTWEDWITHSDARKKEDFFSDGVHPSALTYRLWGQDTARFIHETVLEKNEKLFSAIGALTILRHEIPVPTHLGKT